MDGHDIDLSQAFSHAVNGTLRIDVERYQHMLDSADLTEAQKREILEALWSIIVTVVELGFGVHPLQEVCGKPDNLSEEWRAAQPDALDCKDSSEKDDREDVPEVE